MRALLDLSGYYALRVLSVVMRRLPESVVSFLGACLGRVVFLVSSRRRVAYADLKAALGSEHTERERWGVVRRQYEHLGKMGLEILRFPVLSRGWIEKNIRISNLERFEETVGGDHGTLLMTGHFGNWELLQIVSGIFDKPIHALNRTQKLNRINEYLNNLRETHGSVAVSRGMRLRDLLRALKRKELVGILADQDAGRDGGVILPFFGRKTTVPTGAFELAYRTGVPILPAFIVRGEGLRHSIYVEEPLRAGPQENEAEFVERGLKAYVGLLENYIRKFPEQWLWGTKRWKYAWTKRLLILSDGKPGHRKQSEAVAKKIQKIRTQYGRPGMEYPLEEIEVRFRSPLRKKFFPVFAFFLMPWIQGRLRWLSFFFAPETQRQIEKAGADFILSAGASLVPLSLCLSKENRAKSVVLMKPGFPFNLFRYDLAIVPGHDRGPVPPNAMRLLLTPHELAPDSVKKAGEILAAKLRDPRRIKAAVFLGGNTRDFCLDAGKTARFFRALCPILGETGDYLVTTSRRTPEEVVAFLKEHVRTDPRCQSLVVANEENPPETVAGMMALAEVLVVTEDSISMISEAVGSGKKVLLLDLGTNLPAKHRRFIELLVLKSAVLRATPDNFGEQWARLENTPASGVVSEEDETLQKRLQEIL